MTSCTPKSEGLIMVADALSRHLVGLAPKVYVQLLMHHI